VDAVIGVEMMSQSEPESTTVPPLPKGECSNPNRAFAKRALWAYDRIAPTQSLQPTRNDKEDTVVTFGRCCQHLPCSLYQRSPSYLTPRSDRDTAAAMPPFPAFAALPGLLVLSSCVTGRQNLKHHLGRKVILAPLLIGATFAKRRLWRFALGSAKHHHGIGRCTQRIIALDGVP